MAHQRFDPERDLRAWADALLTVADLQRAIVAEAEQLSPLDDQKWLEPFRAIIFGTLMKTFPERVKDTGHLDAAIGLKQTATEALAQLHEEVEKRKAYDPIKRGHIMNLEPVPETSREALSIDFSARKTGGELYLLADVSFSTVVAELLSAVQSVLPDAQPVGEDTDFPVSLAMAIPSGGSDDSDLPRIQGKSVEVESDATWTAEARSGSLLLCLRVYIPRTWRAHLSTQTIESLKEHLNTCLQGIATWYTVR